MRTVVAFFVAPFPIALMQSIVVGIWPKEGMGIFEHPASMFVAMCLYFYAFGLILGLPAWLVLRKRNITSLQAYAIVGLAVGLIPISIPLGMTIAAGQASAYIAGYNMALFGLGGLIAGSVFWRISRAERPDAMPEGQTA